MVNSTPGLMQKWAALGATVEGLYGRPVDSWEPIRPLVAAAKAYFQEAGATLRSLVERSSRQLQPLGEPLQVDLGLHRWLAEEREEAYSDWLQWVVEQIREPRAVCQLFDISPPANVARWDGLAPQTWREYYVLRGHVEREGRLDLFIRYGEHMLIVVELKKGAIDAADLEKQLGYSESLQRLGAVKILLGVEGSTGSIPGGFKFVPWSRVCIELRRLVPDLSKDRGLVVGAMVLAFVAAVEQNLMGYSAGIARAACQGLVLPDPAVLEHLARYLGTEE
jgi:hypothetical protein